MEKNEIENGKIRCNLLQSGLASLALMVLFTLSSCGDEKGMEEPVSPQGRTAVTVSMATKSGEQWDELNLLERKIYVYRQEQGNEEYILTEILDLKEEATQVLDFEDEYLTEKYNYRFFSYIRLKHHYHKSDAFNLKSSYAIWYYLEDGSLKDLDEGIGSSWEDIRLHIGINTSYDGWKWSDTDYYNVLDITGPSIDKEREIKAELTNVRGRVVIEFFKSTDGTSKNAVATSDGKSILLDPNGDWPYSLQLLQRKEPFPAGVVLDFYSKNHYFQFEGTALEIDPDLESDQYLTATYQIDDKDFDLITTVKADGSTRLYWPLMPAGEYFFEMFFSWFDADEAFLYLHDKDAEKGITIRPGTNTVIKIAVPGDRVWETGWNGGFQMEYMYPSLISYW